MRKETGMKTVMAIVAVVMASAGLAQEIVPSKYKSDGVTPCVVLIEKATGKIVETCAPGHRFGGLKEDRFEVVTAVVPANAKVKADLVNITRAPRGKDEILAEAVEKLGDDKLTKEERKAAMNALAAELRKSK